MASLLILNSRLKHIARAVYALMALNIIVTFAFFSTLGYVFIQGMMWLPDWEAWKLFVFSYQIILEEGYIWTPLTSMFAQANILHLLGNMFYLFIFGSALESEVGAKKMVKTYLIGGLIAVFITPLFYGYDAVFIGSSAAISALAGYLLLTKPLKFSYALLMPQGVIIASFLFYNAVASAVFFVDRLAFTYTFGNVSTLGHLTGLFFGFFAAVSSEKVSWKKVVLAVLVGFGWGLIQLWPLFVPLVSILLHYLS